MVAIRHRMARLRVVVTPTTSSSWPDSEAAVLDFGSETGAMQCLHSTQGACVIALQLASSVVSSRL